MGFRWDITISHVMFFLDFLSKGETHMFSKRFPQTLGLTFNLIPSGMMSQPQIIHL